MTTDENLITQQTKRKIKNTFIRGEIEFSDAISDLMFEHGMDRGETFNYLIESRRVREDEI